MRIDHPLPIALALSCFAGLSFVLLHPRPAVQLEGEIAMLAPADALRKLDESPDSVSLQRNLALTHAALALNAGEFAVTRRVLLALKSSGEDSVEIEEMLADASRLAGNSRDEITFLANAYMLEPSQSLRQKLGLAYRERRLPTEERQLLLAVPAEDLTAYEAHRLAQLLRQTRDFPSLERLYRIRAEGDASDANEAKQQLINFELEAGQSQQAQRLALSWFEASRRNQDILKTAIPAFVNWGALDEAMSLAYAVLEISPKGSYPLIIVFLDGGHQDRAFEFQSAWLARMEAVPDETWPILIDVAERTGNLAGLRLAMSRTSPGKLPADIQARVLLQFLRYQTVQALYPYAAYMRKDVLLAQPLIGAAWSAFQGNQSEAAVYLALAQKQEMTDWDWLIWDQLAKTMRGTPAYQILLGTVAPGSRAQSVLETAFMAKVDPSVQAGLAHIGD